MHLLNTLPQRLDSGATPTFAGLIATSLTSPASTNLTLGLGTGGTALTLASSTLAATFAGAVTTGGSATIGGTTVSIQAAGGGAANLDFLGNTGSPVNARIQYDQIANTSGQLFFQTANSGSLTTKLTLSNTGAATFAGTVTISSTTAASANVGALVIAGGISAGNSSVASYFGGTVSAASVINSTGVNSLVKATDGSVITKIQSLSVGDPNVGYVGTESNHPLKIVTNNTARLTIDSTGAATFAGAVKVDGNMLVGKATSSLGTAGIEIFAAGYGQFTANEDASLFANRLGTDGDTVKFYRATSQVGSISVTTSLTSYNTTSDYRLKTVIGPVANAGQRIDALHPVEYTWNSNGTRTRGFLAHQFQEVYASSVTGTKDAVDAEGKPVYQAMQASTSEVIADLVAELQSLRKRLATLEAK